MKPSITILTGAGISAESGLRTFRDADGLWEGHRVEDVATPEAFERDPSLVLDFYNQRRAQLPTVTPNAAHFALAKLEQEYDGPVTLITQNVDDLHERGGSKNILHIHGELLRKKCIWCDARSDCLDDIEQSQVCDSCSRSGGHILNGKLPAIVDLHVGDGNRNADIHRRSTDIADEGKTIERIRIRNGKRGNRRG